jgi:thiamine biosynthesis lipoprotein
VRLIVAARSNGRRLRTQRGTPAWLLVCLAFLAGCTRAPLHQQESYVFGTRVEVLIYGEDREKAREATAAVLREFDRLHRKLHAWQPSELTRLNEAIAAGATAEVDSELAAILSDARRIAGRSGELFTRPPAA